MNAKIASATTMRAITAKTVTFSLKKFTGACLSGWCGGGSGLGYGRRVGGGHGALDFSSIFQDPVTLAQALAVK